MKRNNPSSRGTFEVFATACVVLLAGVLMASAQDSRGGVSAVEQPMGPSQQGSYQPRPYVPDPNLKFPPVCFNGNYAFTIVVKGQSQYECPPSVDGNGNLNCGFDASGHPVALLPNPNGDVRRPSCPFGPYKTRHEFGIGAAPFDAFVSNFQPYQMSQRELKRTQQELRIISQDCPKPAYVEWHPAAGGQPGMRNFICRSSLDSTGTSNMGSSTNYLPKRLQCPDGSLSQMLNGEPVCLPDAAGSCGFLEYLTLPVGNDPQHLCVLKAAAH